MLLTPSRVALLNVFDRDSLGGTGPVRGAPALAFPPEPWCWHTTRDVHGEVEELNAAVAMWADRWNLARCGAGGWVLPIAALTLHRWADCEARGLEARRHAFELPAHAAYLPPRDAAFLEEDGLRAPFPAASQVRARVKAREGAPVEVLQSLSSWHLVALARWQVAGDGAEKAGQRWVAVEHRKVPPDNKGIRRMLQRLARHLDLPERPNARPGRPRRSGR